MNKIEEKLLTRTQVAGIVLATIVAVVGVTAALFAVFKVLGLVHQPLRSWLVIVVAQGVVLAGHGVVVVYERRGHRLPLVRRLLGAVGLAVVAWAVYLLATGRLV